MKRINCEIQGVTPLLLHAFSDAAAADATEGQRAAMEGDRGTPREQAEACLYLHDGKPIMPAPNIFCCLVEAGKFFKTGKRQWTTTKTSLVPSALALDQTFYDLEHKEPWVVDTRPVRIPSTGGRILRHRPSFNDWKISFDILLDEASMSPKTCRDLADAAFLKVGLCDFRPSCKGFFGRSKITSWKVVDL